MILYILYIEPLLLYLGKLLNGYPLKSPVIGGLEDVDHECTTEDLEAYVDDSELIMTSDSDFLLVDDAIRKFEKLSGAILNRSSKSKVVGLGEWKGRTQWALDWLKTVDELKIFGFLISSDVKSMISNNWSVQFKKFKDTLFSWSTRILDTLIE